MFRFVASSQIGLVMIGPVPFCQMGLVQVRSCLVPVRPGESDQFWQGPIRWDKSDLFGLVEISLVWSDMMSSVGVEKC